VRGIDCAFKVKDWQGDAEIDEDALRPSTIITGQQQQPQ